MTPFEKIASQAKKIKQVQFAMQNTVAQLYYQHIIDVGQAAGFLLDKVGILMIGQGTDQNDWHVDEPFAIEADNWATSFLAARGGDKSVSARISDAVKHAQKRITVPIITLVK